MRKTTAGLLAVATAMIGSAMALAVSPAQATTTPVPNDDPCQIGSAWFVNPDEGDRKPERGYAGFTFEDTDLIHHDAPTGLTVETLNNGDFTASPAPDQASFFSVEVAGTSDPAVSGYATLRWNPSSHEWEMTTGGQFYHNSDPALLVEMPPAKKSHKVVRFGVGYTKNPPGTVKTTVKSVSFMGEVYRLSCTPPTTRPTHRPTVRPTHPRPTCTPATVLTRGGNHPIPACPTTAPTTVPPTTTRPTTVPPTTRPAQPTTRAPEPTVPPTPSEDSSTPPIIGKGSSLPLTGPSGPLLIGGGVLLIIAGIGLLYVLRRRKVTYDA